MCPLWENVQEVFYPVAHKVHSWGWEMEGEGELRALWQTNYSAQLVQAQEKMYAKEQGVERVTTLSDQ